MAAHVPAPAWNPAAASPAQIASRILIFHSPLRAIGNLLGFFGPGMVGVGLPEDLALANLALNHPQRNLILYLIGMGPDDTPTAQEMANALAEIPEAVLAFEDVLRNGGPVDDDDDQVDIEVSEFAQAAFFHPQRLQIAELLGIDIPPEVANNLAENMANIQAFPAPAPAAPAAPVPAIVPNAFNNIQQLLIGAVNRGDIPRPPDDEFNALSFAPFEYGEEVIIIREVGHDHIYKKDGLLAFFAHRLANNQPIINPTTNTVLIRPGDPVPNPPIFNGITIQTGRIAPAPAAARGNGPQLGGKTRRRRSSARRTRRKLRSPRRKLRRTRR